jgi:hypothetical protein
MRRGGGIAFQETEEFFMQTGKVHQTLRELVRHFNEAGIPYALVGALAMGPHGFNRVTVDIDVLLTAQGLEAFRSRYLGLGYVPAFPGAKKALRATDTGVRIDIILTGEYPGDGLPKPVRFPDPSEAAQEIDGVRVLTLERLIELKLASGMTAPHRRSDLADVQRLIRELRLTTEFGTRLDASVQALFQQIWQEAQTVDRVHEDEPPGT